MSEEDAGGLVGSNLDNGGLQDHIAHWVEVLDRWVKGIDRGMGKPDGEDASADGEAGDRGSIR
jgi:hypothetical protein